MIDKKIYPILAELVSNQRLELTAGWEVYVGVDEDGHLNIDIKNSDNTKISEIGDDGENDNHLSFRYTTKKIEDDYLATLKD
jgi:hypothetical protein